MLFWFPIHLEKVNFDFELILFNYYKKGENNIYLQVFAVKTILKGLLYENGLDSMIGKQPEKQWPKRPLCIFLLYF